MYIVGTHQKHLTEVPVMSTLKYVFHMENCRKLSQHCHQTLLNKLSDECRLIVLQEIVCAIEV